jgi:predicted transcriptional regulator of viral defense system
MKKTKRQRVIQLLNKRRFLRPRDLDEFNISREYLNKLYAEGVLERPSRGLYVLPDSQPSEHRTIVEACKLVPKGIVCLLTALRIHELTTESPFEVWMAISEKDRKPRIDYPPIRIVRHSGQSLSYGVKTRKIEGVKVSVYSPAKTVADCFKYRNKIGLDVAIEALRDCRKQKKATNDEIWKAAKICRMANVMRPYMESVT